MAGPFRATITCSGGLGTPELPTSLAPSTRFTAPAIAFTAPDDGVTLPQDAIVSMLYIELDMQYEASSTTNGLVQGLAGGAWVTWNGFQNVGVNNGILGTVGSPAWFDMQPEWQLANDPNYGIARAVNPINSQFIARADVFSASMAWITSWFNNNFLNAYNGPWTFNQVFAIRLLVDYYTFDSTSGGTGGGSGGGSGGGGGSTGTLVLKKITNPSSDTTTEFQVTVAGPSSFNATLTGGDTQTVPVTAGTYNVAERPIPSGWTLTSTVVSNSDPPTAIVINAGDTVTVTFTNTQNAPAPPGQPPTDNSQPCCSTGPNGSSSSGSRGTTGTTSSNAGPVLATVNPTGWTPECTGGGTVPSAADLTDSELWV